MEMNKNTVLMKIRRVEKEYSTLSTKELRDEADKLISKFIAGFGANNQAFVFLNHPKPTCLDEMVMSKLDYVAGYIDHFDDEYIYCRIFDNVVEYVDVDKMRATMVFLMARDKEGVRHLRHLCRINIALPEFI